MKKHSLFIFCLILFRLNIFAQLVPGFNIPDTVCVNQTFTIQNTTTGGSTYYWNFCSNNLTNNPVGVNLGNLGSLNEPVYSSFAKDGNNNYVFITNYLDGTLTRLNFGNSLLNTPVAANLGTLGVMGHYTEGIQVKKDSLTGNWYAYIVGGIGGASPNYIGRISFGTSLANTPTMVSLGNISNAIDYPHCLYLFQENNNWYGFVTQITNSNILRLSFGTSLSNTPTIVNLGNIGSLNAPVGFYPIKENGIWYAIIPNQNTNSLTRLTFGNSLLNTPTGVNLGNINNTMHDPRSLIILRDCNNIIGFVVNEITTDIVRLNFSNSITNTPTGVSLGNIANFSFPHNISEMFRVGDSLFTFVLNVTNNTISRLCFKSCTNASIPSSTLQTPPAISYNTPGTYNISLTINEGLPNQAIICKQIVVVGTLSVHLGNDTTLCNNMITLNAGNPGNTYHWSTGATTQQINVNTSETYSVKVTNSGGCTGTDTINVIINSNPVPILDTIDASNHGILAHYQFDNNTYDISGHNYHGILNGPVPTTDRYNNPNKAYLFNGDNQYVGVPYDVWSDELTLSAWFYANDFGLLGAPIQGRMIFFKAPNTGYNQDYDLAVAFIGNIPKAQFIFGQSSTQYVNLISNSTLQTNQWYLLTATRKNGVAKLYINGILDNSTTYSFTPFNQHFNLRLGMSNSSFQSFSGKLDDLRIYGRELCSREIKSLYLKQYLLKTNLQDTIVCINGNTVLQLINPEPGITYQLLNSPSGTPYGNSVVTYCDTILSVAINNIITTSYFKLLAKDTVTGCNRLLDSIKISVSPPPIVNLGNDTTICIGSSLTLNAANTGSSYLWNTGVTTQQINVSTSGSYWVKVTNSTGCIGADTIHVTISPLYLNLGNDTILCTGSSLILNAGNIGSTYLWNTGAVTQQINVSTSGIYWVNVITGFGCIGSDTINVNVSSPPIVNLANDTSFCEGESIILDAQNTGASYLWNTGATSQQINASSSGNYWVNVTIGSCQSLDSIYINIIPNPLINLGNDTNLCTGSILTLNAGNTGSTYIWNTGATTQQINVSTTGNYWVKVINSFGCSGADTINLTFSPLYINIGNDTILCIGDSVTLNAGITGGTYQWNTGAITQSINVSDAGNYWVEVNWGNCNNSDTITINTVQRPIVNLGNDTIMCPGDLIMLYAGSGYNYLWSNGGTQATLNVNYPGTYSVTVSNAGCIAFDEIKIAECNSEIWVPNVFTPNGDGINETFYPVCTNIEEITMYVYNRWGNQIYEGSGRNLKWDGRYMGKMCPDGVYYYLINYTYKGNGHVELKQLHGSVTLLK